jgi:hypothetical protein
MRHPELLKKFGMSHEEKERCRTVFLGCVKIQDGNYSGTSLGPPAAAQKKGKFCGDTPRPGHGTDVPRHPLLSSYAG